MALRPSILARDWLITTEHYLSAQAGAAVLQSGGNALDAAVAAILVEGVVNPHMLTVDGEVAMLVREAETGAVRVVNGNTMAPRALSVARCRAAGLSAIPPDHPYSWDAPTEQVELDLIAPRPPSRALFACE